jgi:hypothetical protein
VALIVAVHGIAQQILGEDVLESAWLPALRSGLKRAGARRPADSEFACAFYGDLFRKKGTRAAGPPPLTATDVRSEWERDLLVAMWQAAATTDANVSKPDAKVRARTPEIVQRALNNLLKSSFFAGVAERGLIWDLKQVAAYLNDDDRRAEMCARVRATIAPDTRVVIGHSLGSVVAYEVLCAMKSSTVTTFVTLGSPLGIPNLVFHKLRPAPKKGIGLRPPVERWFNIADRGDIVALVKKLGPLFGGGVHDDIVHNESRAHDVVPYLTSKETGVAVASGIG